MHYPGLLMSKISEKINMKKNIIICNWLCFESIIESILIKYNIKIFYVWNLLNYHSKVLIIYSWNGDILEAIEKKVAS